MRTSARAVVIKDDQLLVMERNKFGFKYLSLLGGAVEPGEGTEEAALREVREESTMDVVNPKLVIIEDAGEVFGIQYIYKCDYLSGEPKLDPTSEEAKINAGGKNLYTPKWLNLSELESSSLLPQELKELLVKFIRDGFPDKPFELQVSKDSKL
jgi:8-oxo-dGTP diphosphatase